MQHSWRPTAHLAKDFGDYIFQWNNGSIIIGYYYYYYLLLLQALLYSEYIKWHIIISLYDKLIACFYVVWLSNISAHHMMLTFFFFFLFVSLKHIKMQFDLWPELNNDLKMPLLWQTLLFVLWPHYHHGCALFSKNSTARCQVFFTYSVGVKIIIQTLYISSELKIHFAISFCFSPM